MIIDPMNPEKSKLRVEQLLKNMEELYKNEYYEEFIPLLSKDKLEEVYFLQEYIGGRKKDIGFILLEKVKLNDELLKTTMLRLLPEKRGEEFEKRFLSKLEKLIIEKYNRSGVAMNI